MNTTLRFIAVENKSKDPALAALPVVMQSHPHDEALEKAMWGTYGLPAKLPCRWVRLWECTTGHLCNILTYPGACFLSPDYRDIIFDILDKRGVKPSEMLSIGEAETRLLLGKS